MGNRDALQINLNNLSSCDAMFGVLTLARLSLLGGMKEQHTTVEKATVREVV